jgi:hypothetical protein
MNTTAKSVLFPLLVLALAILNTPRASAADGQEAQDSLCDYCKDYTDAAATADPVRSTFRPGIGYGQEAETERGREDQQARKDGNRQEQGVMSPAHASEKVRD